jgi:LysR family transcriptional activator of mexEF-oprN operon
VNVRTLRNLDLNLLVAFSVLMRERHVSRAARALGIGQPGLSGALGRLREAFDDPLLVRVGGALQPTARALELAGPIEQALELIEQTTTSRGRFDPRSSDRTFVIGMTDDHELLFAARLASALGREAPQAHLVIRAVDIHTAPPRLDDGSLDLALGAIRTDRIASWHGHTILFSEGYACVWSARHLTLPKRLTLDRYLSLPHVLVTFDGQLKGRVDDLLTVTDQRRNVVLGVPRFAVLPEILSAIPAISTVPAPVARLFACQRKLAIAAPPLDIPAMDYGLMFRERDASLADLAWFRGLVAKVVAEKLADIALAHRRS